MLNFLLPLFHSHHIFAEQNKCTILLCYKHNFLLLLFYNSLLMKSFKSDASVGPLGPSRSGIKLLLSLPKAQVSLKDVSEWPPSGAVDQWV